MKTTWHTYLFPSSHSRDKTSSIHSSTLTCWSLSSKRQATRQPELPLPRACLLLQENWSQWCWPFPTEPVGLALLPPSSELPCLAQDLHLFRSLAGKAKVVGSDLGSLSQVCGPMWPDPMCIWPLLYRLYPYSALGVSPFTYSHSEGRVRIVT